MNVPGRPAASVRYRPDGRDVVGQQPAHHGDDAPVGGQRAERLERRPRAAPGDLGRGDVGGQGGRGHRTSGLGRDGVPTTAGSGPPASKQVRAPVWQAAPTWSTSTSSASPSQSRLTALTYWRVAGRVALAPVLLARAAPEHHAARGQRAVQRLVVHPAEHEHLARVVLLHDGGDEAVLVALQALGDGGIEGGTGAGHVPILPRATRRRGRRPSARLSGSATPRRGASPRRGRRARRGRRGARARRRGPRRPRRPRRPPRRSRAGARSSGCCGPGSASRARGRCAPRSPGRPRRWPRRAAAGPRPPGTRAPGRRAAAPPPTATRRAARPACRARAASSSTQSSSPSASTASRTRASSARPSPRVVAQAVRHVLGERAVEQEALLRHEHHAVAQLGDARCRAGRRRRAAPAPARGP